MLFVQNADNRVFAIHAGHDGDPKVNVALADAHPKAPVLRRAPLGNVKLGHHLDAGDGLLVELGPGHPARLHNHAVNAVLDHQTAGGGLQMNVGGARAHGIKQRGVDQAHHRAGGLVNARERYFFHPRLARGLGKAVVQNARQRRGGGLQARQQV